MSIELDKIRDTGFYRFIIKQLSIKNEEDILKFSIEIVYVYEKTEPVIYVNYDGKNYSGIESQEILKKIQNSESIIFHNSTELEASNFYPGGSIAGSIRDISGRHQNLVSDIKRKATRSLSRIFKSQQVELENLLGRLKDKYKVGLSLPAFDFSYLPFNVTLGDKNIEVPLNDWGSGTRNRTLVFLALFRAKQIEYAEPNAEKITPVIIIEEPESFLHPSAQAEFGRILQDMAAEFKVQVIVTTHSPYLLSLKDPKSNILLRRMVENRRLKCTEIVDTSGENWMAPFGHALGLDDSDFHPWKSIIISASDSILLVEGDIDKEYFSLLTDPAHGRNRLMIDTKDIIPYNGFGSLQNNVLLKFVKERFRRFFVTFDLDAEHAMQKCLTSIQLRKNVHYASVGIDSAGKRNIEGLIPDCIVKAVHSSNPNVVQAATLGTKDEQENAKRKLKKMLLEEFKSRATPGSEFYGNFYPLVRRINKAIT